MTADLYPLQVLLVTLAGSRQSSTLLKYCDGSRTHAPASVLARTDEIIQ
jgi:hypothetical protein